MNWTKGTRMHVFTVEIIKALGNQVLLLAWRQINFVACVSEIDPFKVSPVVLGRGVEFSAD